jgi:hypothetical protein
VCMCEHQIANKRGKSFISSLPAPFEIHLSRAGKLCLQSELF